MKTIEESIHTINEAVMKDYAIFLSLTENYIHLFNALYNSAELFGIGEYAEFVVLHDGIPKSYIDFMSEKTANLKTKVVFVPIQIVPGDESLGKVMTVKFYRYKYMAELGKAYKSILFLDTDIYLASDIREYFEIAANTDLVVATNDNVVRSYKNDPRYGSCPASFPDKHPCFSKNLFDGKFICNVPTFIDMKKYDYVFMDVFENRRKLGMDSSWPFTGDLETMNLVMLKHKLKHKMLVLASHLWTGVHFTNYRLNVAVKRWTVPVDTEISDPSYKRQFLFMSETCEHIRAFHGRDWTTEKSENSVKEVYIPKMISQAEGKFEAEIYDKARKKRESIFQLIQAYCLFLEFDCFISLDDVVKTCQIGDKYEYIKNKYPVLEPIIRTFKL